MRREQTATQQPERSESLLAAFRALSAGEDLERPEALLEQVAAASGAEEVALLVCADAAPGESRESQERGFTCRGHWAHAQHGERLGSRPGDEARVEAAVRRGGVLACHPDAPAGGAAHLELHEDPQELWCPLLVEGRTLGILVARRAAARPFDARAVAAIELLGAGMALAVDRLRFSQLWATKLAQADAAHAQLLLYANDLRATFWTERQHAEQLRRTLQDLEHAYGATVKALAMAVEAKDSCTGGHLQRVSAYGMEAIAVLDNRLLSTPGLQYAFLLHDLGKIGVPDAVLNKAGALTEEEWSIIQEHPAIGMRILDGVPKMDLVRDVVYTHHERWDGEGYPQRLQGEQIPLAARAFSVVDAFDAMTTDRPYRAAMTIPAALARLEQAAGTQFAPEAVEALCGVDHIRLEEIRLSVSQRAQLA